MAIDEGGGVELGCSQERAEAYIETVQGRCSVCERKGGK